MPHDLDELRAVTDRMTGILDAGARARLMALPDTVHVSIGLREVGDDVTQEFVFKVYVAEKAPAGRLAPERLVPAEVDGVRTDVCEVLRGTPCIGYVSAAAPAATDRPLIGGTKICNGYLGKDPLNPNNPNPVLAAGTLGIVVGRLSDRKPVILTNWHVVKAYGGGAKGDPVYQPEPLDAHYPGGPLPWKPTSAGNNVAVVDDAQLTHKVDAAIAQVNPPSSCCSSGSRYTLLIKELNDNGSSGGITGSMPPLANMEVVKVGVATRRVEGTIIDPDAPLFIDYPDGPQKWEFTGQLKIRGHENGPAGSAPKLFADHSDSGSVVVEKTTRKVVGLLHARQLPSPPLPPNTPLPPILFGYASKITDVIAAMGIYFPDSSATHGVTGGFADGTAQAPLDAPELVPDLVPDLVPELQRRLAASAHGRAALEGLTRHAEEIVRLVNRDRRTTVAWHRAQGPSWAAAFARSARVPEYRLPDEIEGVTRVQAVTAMRTVLAGRGGDALAAGLRDTAPAVFTALATCRTVDDLVTALDQQPTTPTAAERRG
ncbi:hypothetical protein ACIGXA_17730 [Streptomyces fildesensis]|uniref:Uncharacterized protein n=1 Tax=Streptomyces fildesensis TaxID=375757 RepID=A0ABW8CAC7_9ACTN